MPDEPGDRSVGLTPSERYLSRLCDKSFLKLWSYANPHRAKGKELCDLLVVFDRHVLIFSDKSCAFKETGSLQVNWDRWYRSSIEKSVDQVLGAERYIRTQPGVLFLDAACTQKFPLSLPAAETMIVHRIVVARGAGVPCRRHFNRSSGSLLIGHFPVLGQPVPKELRGLPFLVGDVSPESGFVHVLDDVSLDIVMRELDTIHDFTAYLSEKERLARSGALMSAAGEEELLAFYLSNVNERQEYEFKIPAGTVASVDEGLWAQYNDTGLRAARATANEPSYAWDALIEQISKHVIAGTMLDRRQATLQEKEQALRIMAAEPRLSRRILATGILEKIRDTAPDRQSMRLLRSPRRPEVAYIFLLCPVRTGETYDNYLLRRESTTYAYCMAARHRYTNLNDIIGISTEPYGSSGSSETLAYVDARVWTPDSEAFGREMHDIGLLRSVRTFRGSTHDMPVVSQLRIDRKPRTKNQEKSLRRARRKGR